MPDRDNMPKYLPWNSYTINTPLSAEEIEKLLDSEVEPYAPWSIFGQPPTNKMYRGVVTRTTFDFGLHDRFGRRFFVIEGSFDSNGHGTAVQCNIRVPRSMIVGLGMWLIAVSVPFFISLFKLSSLSLVLFMMMVLTYTMIMRQYNPHRDFAIKFLPDLLKGELMESK